MSHRSARRGFGIDYRQPASFFNWMISRINRAVGDEAKDSSWERMREVLAEVLKKQEIPPLKLPDGCSYLGEAIRRGYSIEETFDQNR